MTQDFDNPIIKIADVRAAGYCARGARRWFETHGLDFKRFLREGYDAKTLVDTGDSLARRVVAAKIERMKGKTDGRE